MSWARVAVAAVAVLLLAAPLCGALRSSGRADGKFDCQNGKCISGSRWCDGVDNCGNNADETSCRICLSGSVKCKSSNQCVLSGARCNGIVECLDGSDELGCEAVFTTERSADSIMTSVQAGEAQGSQGRSEASHALPSIFLLTLVLMGLMR